MQKTISLNVLDNVEITTPCTASWEEMTGNDQTRYCSHCSLNVYNLSGMTREDATSLISGAEGRVCIRLYRRTDGTVLTQDCPTGLRAARERVSRSIRNIAATVATLVAGLLGLGAKTAWAQGGLAPVPMMGDTTAVDTAAVDTAAIDPPHVEVMGKMAISPARITPPPIQLEPDTARSVAIEPVRVEPTVFEPLQLAPRAPRLVEPEESFEMGDMMIIARPTPESENPVDEPACDPELPFVDGIIPPEIR